MKKQGRVAPGKWHGESPAGRWSWGMMRENSAGGKCPQHYSKGQSALRTQPRGVRLHACRELQAFKLQEFNSRTSGPGFLTHRNGAETNYITGLL